MDGGEASVSFLAALDNLTWDRRTLRHIFSFDYVWEVYKPKEQRRWGYYVLPVLYGDSFVARFDGRCTDNHWTVSAWYWEEDFDRDRGVLTALETAVASFAGYLGAERLSLPRAMDSETRSAFRRGFSRRAEA